MNGDRNRPLYGISVASELTRVDPQALRGHEAKGLVERARTEGGTRRCSRHDLDRINKITALLYGRLTWPGLPRVLQLEAEISRLRGKPTKHPGGSGGRDGNRS